MSFEKILIKSSIYFLLSDWIISLKTFSVPDFLKRISQPNSSYLVIKSKTESEFIINGDSVEFEQINSYPAFSKNNISFNELLIGLFEVEKNLKFKVFESEVDKKQIQNVVFKFNSFENSINALSIMIEYENLSLRKAFLDNNSDSIHLYISIIKWWK